MTSNYSFKPTFLTQLTSINTRSREFPNALTKMLASQENINTAMSLQGEDAKTLVDVLDQTFEAPNMSIDLRRKSVRILRRVCGSQTILPSSCVITENISKEGGIAFASGGFADVWKGRHEEKSVCIKAFRASTAENLSKIKQRLFQEIVIWRRLSHPNILPILGVSPKLFPLCIVSEWMIDGNIMEFTLKHSESNRLRLLAEAASGLQYLHSMDIIHGDLKPANILVGNDFRPRLADYGLVPIILNPNTVDPGNTTSPSVGTVRYMAPELLNPSGFGLKKRNLTKKSDIYAFGMTTYQVLTGQQPFPGAKDVVIIYNVVSGDRPPRPSATDEWVSDDVNFARNALNDAADAVETKRRKTYPTNGQSRRSARGGSGSGEFPPNRGTPTLQAQGDPSIQEVLQSTPPPWKATRTISPFVTKRPAGSGAMEKEKKKIQKKGFRTWHDSTSTHWQEAAFVDYKNGVVHLSSSDGAQLEIPENKLSRDDLSYPYSQDVYKKHRARLLDAKIPSNPSDRVSCEASSNCADPVDRYAR